MPILTVASIATVCEGVPSASRGALFPVFSVVSGKLGTGNWELETGNWELGTGTFYLKSTTAYVPIFGSENSIAPLATT